jgi:hypothetical protein
LDVETLEQHQTQVLDLNEIGEVHVRTSRPLMVDAYRDNRITGSFILIDPQNNATVGAGMIRSAEQNIAAQGLENKGVLVSLPQAAFISTLEKSLLASGEDVVVTRVQKAELWRTLLHAGLIVLVHVPDKAQAEIITLNNEGKFTAQLLQQPTDIETVLRNVEQAKTGVDQDDSEF